MTKTKNKARRLFIIGLTGSIGMGKSTTAQILRKMGFPIYSADMAVHALLKKGGPAVAPVAKLFPESLKRGAINRKILGNSVFGKPQKLKNLEKIIHPLLRKSEKDFLKKAKYNNKIAAILEIPLLFETGADKRCDLSLCVTAPRAIQKARVLSRPHMSEERFRAILARQMPDAQKRKKADFVISTGVSKAATEQLLRSLFKKLALLP